MEDVITQTGQRPGGLRGQIYKLKDWTEEQATKAHATWILFIIAFVESSFFPIPPDVLLIALCVTQPKKSWRFATICTLGSVLGGMAGYGIGYLAWYHPTSGEFSALANLFFKYVPGFTLARFENARLLYEQYDFWVVFTAGFTPVPYKLFTIAGGVFKISFPMFVIASIVGRAGRFFLVGALFYFAGAKIKPIIDRYFELLSVAFLVLLVGSFMLLKLL